MRCARKVIGYRALKMSTIKILKELNWLSLPQLIVHESVKSIHKIVFNNSPNAITQYICFSLHRSELVRSIRKPLVIKPPKSEKARAAFLHRAVYIYNTLPDSIRILNVRKFAEKAKEYIFYNKSLTHIDKID